MIAQAGTGRQVKKLGMPAMTIEVDRHEKDDNIQGGVDIGKEKSMVQTSRRTRSSKIARKGKTTHNRLLVVVDESSSSKRAVEYVASVLASRRGFQLCLAHFLSQMPPMLLEFGGAENPEKEGRLDRQLRTEQQEWIEAAMKKAQPALNWACSRLRRAGLPASSLTTEFSDPFREQNSVSGEILELARINKCRTIIVGRRSLPWLRRLTSGKDLAEKLVQQGSGFTLWIVE
jgi:nucleotide-binding universal stress UspA family protein